MLSYTRSQALSNAVLNANSGQPLQVLPTGPDAVGFAQSLAGVGVLTAAVAEEKKWAIAALTDARSGFPFSVQPPYPIQQPAGVISGAVDSRRYPFNFDLNLAIERMITLAQYRFALRLGRGRSY